MSIGVDGRSTRWDDHRTARRAELVRAARKAVHRLGPAVSMDEIAAAAGTSKSIVYRYFDDKAGLRLAVAETVVMQMHDALRAAAQGADSPEMALREMVRVYLEMIESSPNVYWFVTRTAIGGNEPAPVESGRRGRRAPAEAADATVPTTAVDMHPLGAYLDSVIELVAEPFARATDVSHADAAAWAAGAVGFVRGSGEWWLGHRHVEASPLTREELTERVTLWLWTGPVGVLHHLKPGSASLTS
ncbi:TetR/AcrR family transcriptional regulator [Promicromonospora citrea]|uniref:TetR family transcriptional regulator n=1 Tax=Promicromonospora citrea TaxID=43677 RepID=A0A8H9GDY7_9MICO|nr:TetR/AcrR family transcriptional regulator [Promicromonospora citrea]NNH54368.1 TetR family transcriptional regulator [Promicromonospora citrea]GGM09659.1 TetR family transcriptional regulator [Promicromonospora citrea]